MDDYSLFADMEEDIIGMLDDANCMYKQGGDKEDIIVLLTLAKERIKERIDEFINNNLN